MRPVTLPQRFKGVRDSLSAEASSPDLLYRLDNMYPDPLYRALLPRQGFEVLGTNAPDAVGTNRGLLHTLYKLDGTIVTILITNDRFYKQSVVTGVSTWTEITTGGGLPTDFFSTGSGYSPRCEAVNFADVIVLRGWLYMYKYDGTTFTKLTNAPLMDSLTVYYAKLFGIKHTEQTTMVWSEENDPTIGYEAGGYNNAWTLGQTGSEPLHAVAGANEALYYWRQNSIGAIRGEVTTNFSATGTREGVSEDVGTVYPDSLVAVGQSFWFCDRLKRPYQLTFGGTLTPRWADCEQEVLDLAAGFGPKGLRHPELPLVLFAVTRSAEYDRFLVFHSETGQYFGTWSISQGATGSITSGDNRLNFAAVGVIRAMDGSGSGTVGNPRLAFWCGEGTSDDASYAYVYQQTPPVTGPTSIAPRYNDALDATYHGGTMAVIHWIESGYLGADIETVKMYRGLTITVGQTPDGNGNTQDVYVHHVSPNPTTYRNADYGATGILLQPFDLKESVDDARKFLWYCYAPNGVVRAAMTSDRWPHWYKAALTETGMTDYRGEIITLSGSAVPANLWGAWALYYTTTGTLTVSAATANGTGYASAALARAGCADFTDEQVAIGYICVQAPAALSWTPGTHHHRYGTSRPAQDVEFVRVDWT